MGNCLPWTECSLYGCGVSAPKMLEVKGAPEKPRAFFSKRKKTKLLSTK